MLTSVEKILFVLLALIAIGAAAQGFRDAWLVINRGEGKLHLNNLPKRAWIALRVYITQNTTLKTRKLTSLIHLAVVWGFTYYFLISSPVACSCPIRKSLIIMITCYSIPK